MAASAWNGRRTSPPSCLPVSRAGRPKRITAAMAGDRTIRVGVSPPIPVFIFYTTAIVRADETVEFFDDVYGLDCPTGERARRARAGRDEADGGRR